MLKSLRATIAPNPLIVAILTSLTIEYAAAQPASRDPFPNKTGADLMQSYQDGAAGTLLGHQLLMGVLNKRLAANDKNLLAVRESLAKAGSVEDKMVLIRLLASTYAPRVRSQQNLLIENDIKKLVDSTNRRLATEAVFEYSRLGYPPDRYQVLQRARAEKILDDEAYYGELAHGLRFSSPDQQSRMLTELEAAGSSYGNEILAATFTHAELLGQLDPAAQIRLFKLLSTREPDFPPALDSFGVIDVARYVNWINAVATIGAKLSGKPYADLVIERLSSPRIDPRKILAVFANDEGKRVLRETKDVNQVRRLRARGQAYANSLPQNEMLRGAVQAFSKAMGSMPATDEVRE